MTASSSGPRPLSLRGMRMMVVEDEAIISFLLEDMLNNLGCDSVVLAANVKGALEQIERAPPDAAVLDVNLGNEMVYPVAERLDARRIPFVFTTGYGRGGIKMDWATRPVVQKPFNIEALSAALRAVLPNARQSTDG